jgi:trans-2,3-dihydro-3-hydroxyanthranilate isomerase
VLPPDDPRAEWRLRFFVPEHEMEMCGHATVGTLWALRQWKWWTSASTVVETASGLVDVTWDERRGRVWISQPRVRWTVPSPSDALRVAEVLGVDPARVFVVNAKTSRTKTLVAVDSVQRLDSLAPVPSEVKAVCEAIGSTGLYPFVLASDAGVAARQFPMASGYPEDAATGIAAAALWGYLQAEGAIDAGVAANPLVCTVRQGEAMGRPSAIDVKPRFDGNDRIVGCWLSGQVQWGGL